jgi:hypothetical protein
MGTTMLLTLFTATLALAWLAFTLAAFCPLRARRLREAQRDGDY